MARVAQKVRDLTSEDPGMRHALEVVLDRSRSNGGSVEWGDVDDELSSGQWGRLIEKGILKSGDGDGFRVRDPDGVEQVLDGDDGSSTGPSTSASTDDDEDTGWTTYDKLAGLAALGLFAGYQVGPVRDLVGGTLDTVLGPLQEMLPFYAVILLLAMVTGLYSTLLQANLMDTDKMGEYQSRMQEIQDRYKDAKERGDDDAVDRINEERMEAMGDQMGMMKMQFRPMVWIMLITIPVFLWLYWEVLTQTAELGSVTMPLIGQTAWPDGAFVFPAWILWYFVCSMGFTQILRKALDINTSPSPS
ncbi:DUF106 domain-containing protein [Halomarina oriensis]|uniref:DUF106 domain-containing protein n=1 Tax=Halomarina oriensis TaxID=671145 RepID=A0A6B0GJZ4_9EURY|nr:DUF106 domain-containing protein [Halomarina oriensis]MWG35172.1 DUF106 domain-containing protein [Halomarina oriensis]